jgi:hypothetical protein
MQVGRLAQRKKQQSKDRRERLKSDLKLARGGGETNFGLRGGGLKAFTYLEIAIFLTSVTQSGESKDFGSLAFAEVKTDRGNGHAIPRNVVMLRHGLVLLGHSLGGVVIRTYAAYRCSRGILARSSYLSTPAPPRLGMPRSSFSPRGVVESRED